MCIWRFRGSFFPLQFWVCKVHDRSDRQPAGRLHPSQPHLPHVHSTFPLSLLSKNALAHAVSLFLDHIYQITVVFPPKTDSGNRFIPHFFLQSLINILPIAQSDELGFFLSVYCVCVGKFAMIKQIIGLNRAYLFNYVSLAGGLQIRGLTLCIIRGFLFQIKFVSIMNRNNKDCTFYSRP